MKLPGSHSFEPDDAPRAERARSRGRWPVRVIALGEETSDLRAETTAEQRIAMVEELTLAAWELLGGGIPDYPRQGTPVALRSLRSS